MSGPFRLAVVGAGTVTAVSHLPAVIASPEAEIVALVDPVLGRASGLVSRYNLRARVTSNLAEVLNDVDGAIIATPNNTHFDLVRQCVESRVPVLVEKPLTTTLEDAERLVDIAESAGVIVGVGYCTRFQDNVQLVHALLESNWFGAVQRFVYQYGAVGGWASESGFHLQRDAVGGGLLVDKGAHFLDRLLHWFGYPDTVELEDDSLGGPEANAVARFHYSRAPMSFEGSARFSKTVALPGGLVMESERGTLVVRDGATAPLLFRPRDSEDLELTIGPRQRPSEESMDVFRRQLADFIVACQEGRLPRVSARQGLESVRLLRDLYEHRTPMSMTFYNSGNRSGV